MLILDVTIKNLYNERKFIGDKLIIVDVKAVDEKGYNYRMAKLEKEPVVKPVTLEKEQTQERLNKALLLLKEKGINPDEV